MAGYLLYNDYHGPNPGDDVDSNREIVGELLYVDNNVKRQLSSDIMWNSVEKETPVFNKDSIRTGKDSTAGIRLSDSTVVELGENSLIVIDKNQQALSLQFKAGDLAAKNSGKDLQISVNDSVIKGEGADLKLKRGPDSVTNVQVDKGRATITDKNRHSTEIAQSQQAGVGENGVQEVNQIAVILKTPENRTKLLSNRTNLRQAFTWEVRRSNIKGEQFEIASSPSFDSGNIQIFKAHQGVNPVLVPGTYYWRVGWKSETGQHKLLYTETRQLTIGMDSRLELTFPEDETFFDFHPNESVIDFQWKCQIPVKLYVVEIATSSDFRNITYSKTLTDLKTSVKDLAPKLYYWRVRAFGERNEEIANSPTRTFTTRLKVPKLPELIKPLSGIVIESHENVEFAWKPVTNATEYRLVVSTDAAQKEVTNTKSLSTLNFTSPTPTDGTYYWSVRAMASTLMVGQSEVRKIIFSLKQKSQMFTLISPKNKSDVVRGASETPDPVLFEWQVLKPLPDPVTILISKTEDFANPIKQENLTKVSVPITLNSPGIYYWKLTSKEETSDISTFQFKITNTSPGPTLLEPGNRDVLDADGPTKVMFKWNPSPTANQYHIIVERTDKKSGAQVVVIDRLVNEGTFKSPPLEEGTYQWSVSTLDKQGQQGSSSKTFSFSLATPEQVDAPQINAPVIK